MKFIQILCLATLAAASPVALEVRQSTGTTSKKFTPLEARQSTGTTSKEFTLYGCRDVIFIFARGTTEPGNMVSKRGEPS